MGLKLSSIWLFLGPSLDHVVRPTPHQISGWQITGNLQDLLTVSKQQTSLSA